MKVTILIPTKIADLAKAILAQECSDDKDEKKLNNAVARCNETTVEVDLSSLGLDKSDETSLGIAIAMFAIHEGLLQPSKS